MDGALELIASTLPSLLLLYWGLAAGAAVIALMPVPLASGFRNAVILSACRGKLLDSDAPRALGPLTDWTVPQKWFAHFYAVGSVWAALVLWLLLSASPALPAPTKAVQALALSLALLHLVRRWGETVLLMRYPPGSRMHGIAYLFGLSYYLVLPLTLLPGEAVRPVCLALPRWLIHGGGALAAPPLAAWASTLTPLRAAGVFVFVLGCGLQYHSHLVLSRLAPRGSKSQPSPAKPVYRIPKGGAFELVSCPHYLAEILIYCGLLAAAGARQPAGWLMLVWVASNLALAAGMTQRWYQHAFRTYPRARRALIPFVY